MKTRIFIGLAVMLMTLFGITAYANENNDNPTAEANIDGLNYFLYFTTHEATITTDHTVSGELNIPSEINYKGETFVVKGMAYCSFHNNQGLAKVMIPKTVEGILNYVPHDPEDGTGAVAPIYLNPFKGCTALESIEVDKDNPSLKSVDGVLFSQDGVGQYYYHTNNYKGTGLYCYPEGKQQHIYTIPDGVEWIGGGAVSNNKYLTTLTIPNSMKHICTCAFEGCSNLKDLYCKADNVPVVWESVFKNVPIASATLHVPEGSIEKYKATSPWKDFGNIVALEEEQAKLIICVANNDETAPIDTLYTEDEILWFNDKTREIKFKYSDEEVRKKLWSKSKYLEFRLGENVLFKATRTSIVMSNTYQDLVLCKGSMERRPISSDGYFLYDCFPLTEKYLNDERTLANIQKRAPQWEIFLKYWESKGKLHHDPIDLVSFSQGKRATIILPTTPDASKGKYYRLDRWENGKIIFEEEPNPQARTPYIIVPERDFTIDLSSIDAPDHFDTISIEGVRFIGTYTKREIYEKDNGYGYYIIDKTSDCVYHPDNKDYIIMGALHGHFEVRLDFCYNKEKGEYWDKLEYVLHDIPVSYFPDGTKWTEIRLDTLKYNSWYSKVGDEWVPNFETINYHIQGSFTNKYWKKDFKMVYSDGPEWTDSLALMIWEGEYEGNDNILATLCVLNEYNELQWYPGRAYQFDWKQGTRLYYQTINGSQVDSTPPRELYDFGIIEDIKEGDFGGVRPLKYVDLNGTRIIQGIGVTEWKSGECLFGPVDPYGAYSLLVEQSVPLERHYRSMLVHFEHDGKVLYDVWPAKETVSYSKDQMATIIMPTEPDASKGKYYGLDRCEEGKIIFTEELQPKARVPYIIVPKEDFTIDLSKLELESLLSDTVSVKGAMFIGSYNSAERDCQEGFYIDIIDSTPDCQIIGTDQRKAAIGALRAFLVAPWDDPYSQGGSRGVTEKRELVLKDNPNGIAEVKNERVKSEKYNDAIYDLSGRKMFNVQSSMFNGLKKGLYIQNGVKRVVR